MMRTPCRFCKKPLRMTYSTQYERTNKRRPIDKTCPYCNTASGFGPPNSNQWVQCLKCGMDVATTTRKRVVSRRPIWKNPGYSGNGFFCSLRCGYNYAVKQLERGEK